MNFDGLSDDLEDVIDLNKNLADSDGDDISDYEEVMYFLLPQKGYSISVAKLLLCLKVKEAKISITGI